MRSSALIALVLAAFVAAFAHVVGRPEPVWDRVRREGVIRVGYAPEAPFAWRTTEGRVTGEAPEIARVVFARIGVRRIEWVQTEFRALIPELEAGRFDAIAAGMFITPARSKEVSFSRPTFEARAALLVPRDSFPQVCGFDSLRVRSAARLAVLEGAVEGQIAIRQGMPPKRLLQVPDLTTGLAAVRTGSAQALALTQFTLREATRREPSLHLVFPLCDTVSAASHATGRGAFVFRKEDHRLLHAFDEALASFVGSPAHLRLVAPFGITAADIPTPAAQ